MMMLLNEACTCAWPTGSTLTTFFLVIPAFFAIIYSLFGSLLFISNSFPASFTGTGIIFCTLTPYRQTETVSDTTVATNVHQALNVQLNIRTKFAFHLVVLIDHFSDQVYLLISPVFYFHILVNACF